MTPRAGGPVSLRIVAAVAAWLMVQATDAVAAEAKITPSAIRGAQIGLVRDFKSLPSEEKLEAQLKAIADSAQARRGPSGSRGEVELLFVNGAGVAKDSFPNLARIAFVDASGQNDVCTGFFLDDNTTRILTAAHCTCGVLGSYNIRLGDHPNFEKDDIFVLSAPPVRFGGYSCLAAPENQIGQDLAILRVERLIKGTLRVSPQKLASSQTVTINIATVHQIYRDVDTKRLVGVGFGFTERGELPKSAVAAIIPIASLFCGGGTFASSACASFREFVLADPGASVGANSPDSCGGDSGAPIFWAPPVLPSKTTVTDRDVFLVGITSRALDGVRHISGTTCGGGGIYTAVGHPDVVRWLGSHGVFVRTELQLGLKSPPSTR